MTKYDDLYNALTVGELKDMGEMTTSLADSISAHTLVHYLEPDHECADDAEWIADMPELTPAMIQTFFAFEASALDMFNVMRQALRAQGYPVTKDEVS